MGLKELKKEVKVILIASLVISGLVLSGFLVWWFKPINTIEIYNDWDFSRKYHFPGEGTKEDPYVIDGFKFAMESDYKIKISYVTKYFVIQNCIFKNTGIGIQLSNIEGGFRIIGNTFHGNIGAIEVFVCQDCLICNNTFINHNEVIGVGCRNLTIENNTFSNENFDLGK